MILPQWHQPNLGSKVLALCQRRLPGDWLQRFGYPLQADYTELSPADHGRIETRHLVFEPNQRLTTLTSPTSARSS